MRTFCHACGAPDVLVMGHPQDHRRDVLVGHSRPGTAPLDHPGSGVWCSGSGEDVVPVPTQRSGAPSSVEPSTLEPSE